MIYIIQNICEFIRKNKGYYLWDKNFSNEQEAKTTIQNFSYHYNYDNYVKILILQENDIYKLFFIYITIYDNIINNITQKCENINKNINENKEHYTKLSEENNKVSHIIQQLDMDNFPIIFIKYIIKNIAINDSNADTDIINNFSLIHQDDSLQFLANY